MQTGYVSGKIRNRHIASLGSTSTEVSVRERLAFWAKLPERLARLGNRVGPEEHGKIYEALHARIPMVTPDDQRAIQEENAKDDERFWNTMRNLNASTVDDHKRLVAEAETTIAKAEAEAARAAEAAEAAKARLEKIRRGETVSGGLGKTPDLRTLLKEAGWTSSQLRRCELLASLTKAEFETLIEQIPDRLDEMDRASKRDARRIIRARP